MKVIHWIALILVIIGALNWGMIGFFQIDVISSIFGGPYQVGSRIIFALVGLAGLWSFYFFKWLSCCCCCGTCDVCRKHRHPNNTNHTNGNNLKQTLKKAGCAYILPFQSSLMSWHHVVIQVIHDPYRKEDYYKNNRDGRKERIEVPERTFFSPQIDETE